MKRLKEIVNDRVLMKYSLFIIFTMTILYIIYFALKNINVAVDIIDSIIGALMPFIIGLVIAYFINPLVELINKRLTGKLIPLHKKEEKQANREKKKRLASVILAYLIIIAAFVAIIYGLSALIVGQFVFKSIPQVFESLTQYLSSYENTFNSWVSNIPEGVLGERLKTISDYVLKMLAHIFSNQSFIDGIGGFFGGIVNFFVGFFVSLYLVYDKALFTRIWNKGTALIFGKDRRDRINGTLNEINGIVSMFVRGMLLDALIVAVLSSVGLSIMGLKFAVFIGIFAGICNIIPFFGPVLGMIPAFAVGVLTDNFWTGVLAVAILFVIQQIDGNVIYPKVVGKTTGLHPLVVILAVLAGGVYAGLLGMIIAIPVMGVLKLFIVKWAKHRELRMKAAGRI